MNRYTFVQCVTNQNEAYIAFLGYRPQVFQILHDGQLVGWLTDQYHKKNNWRIFAKFGGVQIQPWDINTVKPLSEVMAYIQTLPGSDFINFDNYVYVQVETVFGMIMFISPDEGGYYYLSHRPSFMERKRVEKIDFEKELSRQPALDGDKIKSIEIKSIGVLA